MELMAVGLDCKKAPLEVREKLSFGGERLNGALAALVSHPHILEAAILSTCNRVELYLVASHARRNDLQAEMRRFLSDYQSVPENHFAEYLYYHHGRDAVAHLFEVASGIQSMVIGECQIQGQVRDAIEIARKQGTAGRVLDSKFRAAISAGKRARTETTIAEYGVSVSYTAVELVKKHTGSLAGKVGMVLGSGQTAKLTAHVLMAAGVSKILIVNRTLSKAHKLAEHLGINIDNTYELKDLSKALEQADVVICSTGSPFAVIEPEHLEKVMPGRVERPLNIVDIAVPRDVAPDVSEILGVQLWDLDDVKKLADENLEKRRSEVQRVKAIVNEEIEEFMSWLGSLAVVPTITTLRKHADTIRRAELERIRHTFGDLSDKQVNMIEELTSRIVNKLLHEPTTRLKEVATSTDGGRYAEVVKHLFALQGAGHETN
ncbi:glutamyl-tRNA reductase [Candidatus Chlorohelix sp.]|uniref:glutamyl-tRNA reductase n=1 Tax=Candidatus Chlorohelix sp. TaxID=3139201 RepID=UPI0030333F25